MPLAGPAVHLTGKPSRLGGAVARVFGWITLAFGSTVALLVGWLFQALFPAGIVGWVFGIGIFVTTLILAAIFLFGGRALRDSGVKAEARTFQQAVTSLAEARGGVLSATDVAMVLGLTDAEADRLLTEFAKKSPERVRVELDEQGTIVYQFPHAMIGNAQTEYSMRAVDLKSIRDAAIEEAAADEAGTRTTGAVPTRRSAR